jgi:hypothetical protein
MSTWFYYDADGQKQGPITGGQLKGLAKTGRIAQGEKDEIIGQTRNSRGEVIAASTQRVQYNIQVTTKENEFKCKHCGYQWIGTPYEERATI